MSVEKFVINYAENTLEIDFSQDCSINSSSLSFEYLRVFSPGQTKGKTPLVTHKKQVKLVAIESVAKHGVRLVFDDQHNAIYSDEYLENIALYQKDYWQEYLEELSQSGHSREAMIDFKQV